MSQLPVDLHVDLNSEDDTGLPWGLLDRAAAPGVIVEGNWIVVGSGSARAVAQVADIEGNVVHVRPLPGPVSRHQRLLGHLTG
jgi:hypothetical protein